MLAIHEILIFKDDLYKPLRESELNKTAEIILPHENENFFDSKEGLKNVDFMIAEVSYPSTDLGIELGWASIYGIKIIAIYKSEAKVSSSVKHIANHLVEYN